MAPVDVNAIRKTNIRRLISEIGGVSAFAEKVGTNPDYVSSLLSVRGNRNPGDSLMRRIEAAFELPPGSLDFPDEASVNAAMAMQALPDDERQQVLDFILYKLDQARPLEVKDPARDLSPFIERLREEHDKAKKRRKR